MNMEIRQMVYFKELAERQNVAAAAKRLYMTPQALNKSMRNLSSEYESELFKRESGKLVLTTFGKALYQEVCKLLANYNDMQARLKNVIAQENKIVKVACSQGILHGRYQEVLKNFTKMNPDINVEYIEYPDLFAEQMVEIDECDLGFCINEPLDAKKFDYYFLQHNQLCSVVSLDHPLANKKSMTLKEFSQYPICSKNKIYKSYYVLEETALKQKLSLNYALCSPDEVAWSNIVRDGKGVGIGTMYYYNPDKDYDISIIPFEDEEMVWDIGLIKLKSHHLSLSGVKLMDYLLADSQNRLES